MGLRACLSAVAIVASAFAADDRPEATPPQPQAQPVARPLGVMRRVTLQDGVPYEVGIGQVPTTILMPAPIEQFFEEGTTRDDSREAPVFLDGKTGERFFSVKALLPGIADINVLCDGKLYSFRFFLSDNPTRTLTIAPPETTSGPKRAVMRVSPKRLYSILQEAKLYDLTQDQYPGLSRKITVSAPGSIQKAGTHRIIVDQVYRFDTEDTLAFRLIFINDTFEALTYDPAGSGIRIGQNVYWTSFADLAGEIPPASPGRFNWKPARPDVSATLTDPDGRTADVSKISNIPVHVPGVYTFTLTAPNMKPESLSFTIDRLTTQTSPPVATLQSRPRSDALLAEASLTQPRSGQSFGYILITGTPEGTRADISLNNTFTVILPVNRPDAAAGGHPAR